MHSFLLVEANISYEFDLNGNCPFGFHVGSYKMKKVGGFFEMNFNGKLFDVFRSSASYGDKPELNIAFGFTRKIASPVWIYFGPGFTFMSYFGNFKENTYPVKNVPYPSDKKEGLVEVIKDDKTVYDLDKTNFAFAVSPTIGIVVKYSYFALRLGYQYRFAFKKELQDYIKANRFTIGVGVAF